MSRLHELWTSALAAGVHVHEELLNLRELLDLRLEHLLAEPGPTRALFGVLRRHHPIVVAPRIAIVSKYDDVLEVLSQDEFFGVTEIYLSKMEATTGDFVLGLPDSEKYQRELGAMRRATHAGDVDRIRQLSTNLAAELVAASAPTGRIDVVAGLSRLVAMRVVGGYFGAPGPDEPTAMRWMRSIFREIFLNLGNDPRMAAEAHADGTALKDYLTTLIAGRRTALAAGEPVPDDFLSRLTMLGPPIDDDTINRIVGGTIVGTVDTNSKAISQAIDQLLDRPRELGGAQAAAEDGDDVLFARYIFEALRFNPQNPLLLRHCEQPYTVAKGTKREALIPEGSLVIVGTESAMFDEDRFPEPETFRIDRPVEDYIHFGHGLHHCFGRHLGAAIIPAVSKQLLLKKGLRRAQGADGTMRYDGAFPDHLVVEFDPD